MYENGVLRRTPNWKKVNNSSALRESLRYTR
jgi:hypothetical protein